VTGRTGLCEGIGLTRFGSVTEGLVLVVDDDAAICDTIEDGLHLAGYATVRATDGMAALEMVRTSHPQLVILDVNMPRLDGFEVLKRMRDASIDTPVIMLTARHERPDAVRGLSLGADDYVKKPFGLEELLLRVRAVLRRSKAESPKALTCGAIVLDPTAHDVFKNGEPVELSPTEYRLLECFLTNKNRVLTKEQLLRLVWGIDFESETTVVETFVSYLRKKLAPEIKESLKTVRGVGFKLVDPS
jgi:two-component system OmpR family response regulator